MNTFTTFYIVRHGETEWNVEKRIQGHADSPLTEKGKEQASLLAKELKHIPFDLAFSSDLLRAKHTAEILALEHTLAVETTNLLRERSFGELEGEPHQALRTFDELFNKLSAEEKPKYKSHGMESDEEIIGRFITFLRETAITHPEKTVLVTTHASMMRTLLIHLGFCTYENITHYGIGNASYITLESDGTDFFIRETKGIEKDAK